MSELPWIRIMPEYCVDWPVWNPAPIRYGDLEDKYGLDTDDLPLTEELIERVHRWNVQFLDHFNEETGWGAPVDPLTWRAEGEAIARDMQSQLGDTARVTFDDWTAIEIPRRPYLGGLAHLARLGWARLFR